MDNADDSPVLLLHIIFLVKFGKSDKSADLTRKKINNKII